MQFLMETPTLNKKQQKSTLSAKKTKTKENIKNVVATPYDNSYWPQISQEDHNTLEQILENNLPKIKNEKINIPWEKLKGTPKPERKKLRLEYVKNIQPEINKDAHEGIFVGINDVTKLLEENLASGVLISSDVQPKIMVQHVIDQAVLYGVPVIIFNDLRNLLKRVCGISSIVVSIGKRINRESKLNLVKESIETIFRKCPAPVNHINYQRSLGNEVIFMESENEKEKPKPIEHKINEDEIRRSVYLIRTSKDRRVFVPKFDEKEVISNKMEVDETGFLAFPQNPSEVENKIIKSNYKSLVVKKLKGNPNRHKRKIESLKRKRK
ncbi:hypothetical protein NQ314_019941 [Rhamnusium bicolor]|uniref:Ribosomal protein eL8/eL30/eS12/Gadd45 domain-containing protein n=1 Tax=Rhamnusium bicolor TaxID=1586634 RepID=A0AAV8WN03_9CUCU|nr:hypothetical protein NQ314_019941 [Rhamnusium bicolor]